jgi:GTPase SAR1 family protein
MATIGVATPPAPTAASAPLQIVLFGMPAAGKTSLLGALGQAAQSQ